VLCTPLRIEHAALRAAAGTMRLVRTGMGPRRAAYVAATLSPTDPVLVGGLAAAQATHIRPGDVVVASELRGELPGSVEVRSGILLAGALRRLGLRVHLGPICSVPRIAWKPVADGSLAVDMESAQLASPDRPFAVVRAIVDTPEHPLWHIGTPQRGIAALRTLRACRPALEWWAAATGPREVLLAAPRSFCAGVARAIDNTVFLIGHPDHEEVQGSQGEASSDVIVVPDVRSAHRVQPRDHSRVAYAMQTTLAVDEAEEIVQVLRERFPAMSVPRTDDICYASTNRQRAVRATARQVDLMLVVGSPNSSNSVRLVEVAQREGVPAYLVEDVSEIDLRWLAGRLRLGITAGASAPPHLVDEIVHCLRGLGPISTSESRLIDEDVTFALPKEVS
jgi:hypothetical protein